MSKEAGPEEDAHQVPKRTIQRPRLPFRMRLDATHALPLLCFELLHVLAAADEGNFSVAPQGEAVESCAYSESEGDLLVGALRSPPDERLTYDNVLLVVCH